MTRVPFVRIYASLVSVVVILAVDQDTCDTTKCPGPLEYYRVLSCKPVYENEGDCCAKRYDCDHLYKRSVNKCYVNGNEYEIGQHLREEDANPCDVSCTCVQGHDGVASFNCVIVDCFFPRPEPPCYRTKSALQCCPGEIICPEKPEDRATCVVDGKTYKDGEYFTVGNETDMTCICQPGYEGENVEPFCAKAKRPHCTPEFRHAGNIHHKCAPVYYQNQRPQTSCSVRARCQNDNDTVIRNRDDLKSGEEAPDEKDMCLFGNLKMHLGDELNQATDYNSVCVKCVCEVPPVPTCQHIPDNECDYER